MIRLAELQNILAAAERDCSGNGEWISDRIALVGQGRADGPPPGAEIGLWFMSEGKQGLPVDKLLSFFSGSRGRTGDA